MNDERSRGAIRVAVVDDHPIIIEAIGLLVGRQGDMEMVGQGTTEDDAIDLCHMLKPDVLLLHHRLGEVDCVGAIERLTEGGCPTRVLVLSEYVHVEHARRVLQAGVSGYLTTQVENADIIDAIRTVAAGGAYVAPGLAEALQRPGEDDNDDRLVLLSPRERQCRPRPRAR
jgi:two-component system invasion response regulator UvrY